MQPFSQELAHYHQKFLLREAANERTAICIQHQAEVLPTSSITFQQRSLSEPDFAAIRHDLRSTLSEWCLEAGTSDSEMAIDTFMQHLRKRLDDGVTKVESVTH